ncbi:MULTISPECIES: HEAT repeat domain-containing protein [Kitasatospora]|uniref:HEAT repeat-containing protein n=1 Tax=Kitasatospora setae (strain ATCC 33774 / DSM 43861 / JCM 3304 / KCC A-0304 / NBRC 14216 / KM-6054) TaxID=452652 RepID=E4NJT4_KITSK|nr:MULTISPECIES: HEAT repeat domain-containing protein [Kitasatospora]BAJ33232.1 hypothetical protein KSE_74770 [Kitasatospora setae KM-6054]
MFEVVRAAVGDGDAEVRAEVLGALAWRWPDDAYPLVCARALDQAEAPTVRVTAARLLGVLWPEGAEALEVLRELEGTGPEEARTAVRQALALRLP